MLLLYSQHPKLNLVKKFKYLGWILSNILCEADDMISIAVLNWSMAESPYNGIPFIR